MFLFSSFKVLQYSYFEHPAQEILFFFSFFHIYNNIVKVTLNTL